MKKTRILFAAMLALLVVYLGSCSNDATTPANNYTSEVTIINKTRGTIYLYLDNNTGYTAKCEPFTSSTQSLKTGTHYTEVRCWCDDEWVTIWDGEDMDFEANKQYQVVVRDMYVTPEWTVVE